MILTPLGGDVAPSETHDVGHSSIGHTPLEPPPSILHTVYSAIKNVFTPAAPAHVEDTYAPSPNHDYLSHQPPPPPQPVPPFKPMTWDAVNSYGEPAMVDAYPDYDPRHPQQPFSYASSKLAHVPSYKTGLTPEKVQKISHNLKKLANYMNENIQRSSEILPTFSGLENYQAMLKKGQVPLFPTPVVSDNEIGVLPADFLPDPLTTTSSTTTSTTTTTTTEKPTTTAKTESETNRRKDVKFILRGNKIVQV